MYQRYFGMKERPFAATPQLDSFFAAAGQEEALATMRYCITEGRGIGLVTGDVGTGKSLVCHRLAGALAATHATALITNTNMTAVKALLKAILYDLALPFRGMDEQELRLSLTDYLLGKYAEGGRTVLIVDEAQNLSVPLLEELRMLGNIEGQHDRLLQIVLFGQTRLGHSLRRPELATFYQRIGARATIEPLSDEETCGYIALQLQNAGVDADAIFTYDALTAVYEATGGVPRLINQMCERALLLAYVAEKPRVEAATIEQASAELANDDSIATVDQRDLASSITMVAPAVELEVIQCGDSIIDNARAAKSSATVHSPLDSSEPIELPRAAEQCSGNCLELLADSPTENTPAAITPTARATEIAPASVTGGPTQDPAMVDEEIIDRFAMMDAARAVRNRKSTTMPTPRHAQSCEPREDIAARERSTPNEPATQAGVTRIQPALAAVAAQDKSRQTQYAAEPEPLFVDSNDHPAVHEVGAGVVADIGPAAETPILVIQPRSIRATDNSIRIDRPQQGSGRGAVTYRRLFTNARKS